MMQADKIESFLDAVDKFKAGDEKAFDGMTIDLDGDEDVASPALGPENKKGKEESK
jgi:hypothetical protein